MIRSIAKMYWDGSVIGGLVFTDEIPVDWRRYNALSYKQRRCGNWVIWSAVFLCNDKVLKVGWLSYGMSRREPWFCVVTCVLSSPCCKCQLWSNINCIVRLWVSNFSCVLDSVADFLDPSNSSHIVSSYLLATTASRSTGRQFKLVWRSDFLLRMSTGVWSSSCWRYFFLYPYI